MCSRDLPPNDSNVGPTDQLLDAIDVGDAFAEVELRRLGRVDAFDLDEGGVGVGISLSALVGEMAASEHDHQRMGTIRLKVFVDILTSRITGGRFLQALWRWSATDGEGLLC